MLADMIAENLKDEATRNKERFLKQRAAGKSYYTAGGNTRFWLDDESLAERLAEGKDLVPVTVTYNMANCECGEPYKEATVTDIEAMLADGLEIELRNC